SAQTQLNMSEVLAFSSLRDFASKLQRCLIDASFLTDGLTSLCRRSRKERGVDLLVRLSSWSELFEELSQKDAWLLNFQIKFRKEPLNGKMFPQRNFLRALMSESR